MWYLGLPFSVTPPAVEIVRLADYETAVRDMLSRQEDRETFDAVVDATLAADPERGDRMPGTGGVRKVRVPLPGRGKRGGARVIYYYVVASQFVFLLTAYAKGDADNVSEAGKRYLRALAKEIDAFRATPRSSKKP
jgi:hypothetical protein